MYDLLLIRTKIKFQNKKENQNQKIMNLASSMCKIKYVIRNKENEYIRYRY